MKIAGKKRMEPEWSSQNGAGSIQGLGYHLFRYGILMELLLQPLSVLFKSLDNNYDYKNTVQGFSHYIIVSLQTTIYFLVVN